MVKVEDMQNHEEGASWVLVGSRAGAFAGQPWASQPRMGIEWVSRRLAQAAKQHNDVRVRA